MLEQTLMDEDKDLLLALLRGVSVNWHNEDFEVLLSYFHCLVQKLQGPLNPIVVEELQSLGQYLSQKSIEQQKVLATVLPFRSLCIQTADAEEFYPRFLAIFLKSCVLSKSYSVGSRFMEHRKLILKLEENAVDPCDVLLTYYYAAVIQVGVKDYLKALQCLKLVFSVPSNVVSDLAVDAYKKYVLVSLIAKGNVEPLAKFSGLFIQRQLKNYCPEYLALAKEFAQRDATQLRQVMENYKLVFINDLHWGLVKETFKALLRSNIKNLTRTFLTLSLEDIATKASLTDSKEAERMLRSMVYQQEISAVIDQRAQMVRFESKNGFKASGKSNTKTASAVFAETNRCLDLYNQLFQFYQNLLTDPQYMFREHSQDGEEMLDHSFC
ncbi:COP9 signalosome complex subunit 3 [Galdieria sulphuraria]|uniref:COP9 signalosome complex subunit 3 n=1 Tax=Galdieria sulphuraria TaxID=130081 RepID=M2XZ81_GALSU|nr:COP9 signalosome complex subunit 3 [Galdieria sulphuraria]EME28958.1 COP9 signalosome complex subunit 3 [Galdieria sulphuraria]|eukprot:XP_005705478.1 COP9 signalosome complex subunit 3 [Galdieria sulphuraria]